MAGPHPHKRTARLAAVCALSLIGAVAAIWTAPRVSGAVEAWMTTPRVELNTVVLPGALPVEAAPVAPGARTSSRDQLVSGPVTGAVTVDAGERFNVAGVTCAPPARRGTVVVLLRTSDDGQAWGRWYPVTLERAAEDGGPERAFCEAIWTGPARYVQVAARHAGARRAPVGLRDVRVVTINSTEDADTQASVLGFVRRTAATVANIDFTPVAAAMTTKPTIVTRAEWGANESWRGHAPEYAPVKMAFVHHTDSGNDYSAAEAPAIMRAIYAYHTKSLHWSDIGYNFLIDRYGVIYEGHYGGVARGVVGAQVLGFNTGSTGISIIGTFTHANPTSASVTSLERLLEWKLDIHHVDPLGTGTLVCGYGQKFATGQHVTFPAISGHRDANYTDCPGNRVYTLLPTVRNVVARTGQPKIYGLMPDDPAISPNGDGVNDSVHIGFTISQQASWTLEVHDSAGHLVRHVEGDGTVVDVTWSGRDDDGKVLDDGVYDLQVDATSVDGTARPATSSVRIDTVPPKVTDVGVAPDPFSPNGDEQDDATTVSYTPSEAVRSRVSVVDADGTVLRKVAAWSYVTAAPHQAAWDGRITTGSGLQPAPEGDATVLVEVRDVAGNTASVRRKVVVDRTLKLAGISRGTFSPNGDGVKDDVTLSFRLTRAADVVAAVVHHGSTARTFKLGRLAAGARSVTWDGKLGAGGSAGSGTYSLKVTADGALGVTSASEPVSVDLATPRLTAPVSVRGAARKTMRISYTVKDQSSPAVKVGAVVTNAGGTVVATLSPGWVKQGAAHTIAWRPRRRGTYTLTFHAIDLGGNRMATPVTTRLRVR